VGAAHFHDVTGPAAPLSLIASTRPRAMTGCGIRWIIGIYAVETPSSAAKSGIDLRISSVSLAYRQRLECEARVRDEVASVASGTTARSCG
jgi:hypothetical protein